MVDVLAGHSPLISQSLTLQLPKYQIEGSLCLKWNLYFDSELEEDEREDEREQKHHEEEKEESYSQQTIESQSNEFEKERMEERERRGYEVLCSQE